MRGRLALGAGAAAALGAVWLLAGGRAGPGSETVDPGPPSRGATPVASAPIGQDAPLPPLPASLRGTDVDGGFVVDGGGRLVVTPDALDLFDYFLAASGEEPDAVIRARIEREIRRRLPPEARPAALDLLDRYLAYRRALRDVFESEDLASRDLERRFQRIREVRRSYFDPAEHEALFAAEEARWRIDVARVRVAHDASLTPEERAERLEALDAELPEDVRAGRQAALAAVRLRADEAALRDAGASEAEVQALRESRFGSDAAARLAALDRRRAEWSRRVDAWRDERTRLIAAGATPEEIAAQRATRFTDPPERRRVEALERMEDAEPARTDR